MPTLTTSPDEEHNVAKVVAEFRRYARGTINLDGDGNIRLRGHRGTPEYKNLVALIIEDKPAVAEYLAARPFSPYPPCPKCRTDLERYEDGLICDKCLLVYPDKGTK